MSSIIVGVVSKESYAADQKSGLAFSERELSLLQGLPQVEMVGLGDLRLRVETAALALLSGARLAEEE